jgi:uncharacterized protein (DUF4415 family)
MTSTKVKSKPGRKPTGRLKENVTLYLPPDVVAYLRGTGCASQVIEDLIRQHEMPLPSVSL